MKLTTAMIVGALCATSNLASFAQTGSAGDASAAPAQQTALIKIATIDGRAANDEFTRNVQVLQSQRQEIVRLSEAMDAAADDKTHDELQTKLDAAVKKLDGDNSLMAKSYGYTILRNYVRIPEKSEIFIVMTPEEIAKQPVPTDGSAVAKTLKVCSLNDAQANQSFQDTVSKLQQLRQQAAALKATFDAAQDERTKSYTQGQFDLAMQQLTDANTAATRSYMFSLNREYVMAIEKSTLYIAATPEEAAKVAEDLKTKAAETPSATNAK